MKTKPNLNNPKFYGNNKSSSKREVDSNTSLPQEIKKQIKKQPNLTPKGARKNNKPQSS